MNLLPVLAALAAAQTIPFERLASAPLSEVLPAVSAFAAQPSKSPEQALLERLADAEPAVRAEAARGLKPYAEGSYEVQRALLDRVGSRAESENARVQAALSLSPAVRRGDARRALLTLAADASQSGAVRGAAFKALWPVVTDDLEVRRAMIAVLADPAAAPPARLGAAWALFADNGGYDSQRALLAAATDARNPEELRLEAVKSLYGETPEASVRRGLKALAEDQSAPESVRAAAALCHLRLGGSDHAVVRWLRELSQSDAPSAVRSAAELALKSRLTFDLAKYFHLAYFGDRHIDPLD